MRRPRSCSEKLKQTANPAATAIRETTILFLSSSRWLQKGIRKSSLFGVSVSVLMSFLLLLSRVRAFLPVPGARAGFGGSGGFDLQVPQLVHVHGILHVPHLGLHGLLELLRGLLELRHGPADRFPDVRELLGPEDEERNNENDDKLRYAETEHGLLLEQPMHDPGSMMRDQKRSLNRYRAS